MKKIRTKKENCSNAMYGFLFAAIWYGALLKNQQLSQDASWLWFVLLAIGALPVLAACRIIHSAWHYRKLHQWYVKKGQRRRGRIVDCEKNYLKKTSNGKTKTELEYVLTIEAEAGDGLPEETLESQPYSWPVYRVLASPEVDVYTHETGEEPVIDGFHYRKNREEPGLVLDDGSDAAAKSRWTEDDGESLFHLLAFLVMAGVLVWILMR